jgi:uncharacterized membrane protein
VSPGAGTPAAGDGARGGAIFTAAVLAFALCDLAFLAGARLTGSFLAKAAVVLSFALLAAFALALAYVAGVVVHAVRTKVKPAGGEALRAAVALALVVAHAVLLVMANRRMG